MTNYIQRRLSLEATRRSQLLKKFHAFHGILEFITTFTKAPRRSMSWARRTQTMYQTWILEIHFSNTFPLTAGRPSCLSKFSITTCFLLSYTHATCPVQFSLHNLFGLRILAKSRIMPLLIKPCSIASQYFCPAWSSVPLCTLNLCSSLNANRLNASEEKWWDFHYHNIFKVYAHL
jgi:hypothetical protein